MYVNIKENKQGNHGVHIYINIKENEQVNHGSVECMARDPSTFNLIHKHNQL